MREGGGGGRRGGATSETGAQDPPGPARLSLGLPSPGARSRGEAPPREAAQGRPRSPGPRPAPAAPPLAPQLPFPLLSPPAWPTRGGLSPPPPPLMPPECERRSGPVAECFVPPLMPGALGKEPMEQLPAASTLLLPSLLPSPLHGVVVWGGVEAALAAFS